MGYVERLGFFSYTTIPRSWKKNHRTYEKISQDTLRNRRALLEFDIEMRKNLKTTPTTFTKNI